MKTRASTLDPGAAARCAFRTVLEHDELSPSPVRGEPDDTVQRRFDAASLHRLDVAEALLELHGHRAVDAGLDETATRDALASSDTDVVVRPRLPRDDRQRRHGAPSLLVAERVAAAARTYPALRDAVANEGRRLRKGGAWRRDVLRLAHHHRMLEAMGVASGAPALAGIIDRSSTLWWLRLDEPLDARGSALAQYDARFAERVALVEATEARNADPTLSRPGSAWWHRECESCPFGAACHDELAAIDDVSLVRFTDATEQELLRDNGVVPRRQLASLDLGDVARGRATADEPSDATTSSAVAVGRRLKDADRLVRRARVEVAGTVLRLVGGDRLDAGGGGGGSGFRMEG